MGDLRGHSTTTWTEFCHYLTPIPLCGQFLYPECGQKQTFFDPPHLVHVVIECPLRTFTPCKLGKNELNNTCYLGLDYLQRFFSSLPLVCSFVCIRFLYNFWFLKLHSFEQHILNTTLVLIMIVIFLISWCFDYDAKHSLYFIVIKRLFLQPSYN